MCGIWGCFGTAANVSEAGFKTLCARGPEASKVNIYPLQRTTAVLGFTRLALNGLTEDGMQPMEQGNLAWVANGEIYNWRELALKANIKCVTGSDCEIIGKVIKGSHYKDLAKHFRSFDGVFATCIVDKENRHLILARDPYGVRPLFKGWSTNGRFYIGSEMKSLIGVCHHIEAFTPGTYEVYNIETLALIHSEAYHRITFQTIPLLTDLDAASAAVSTALRRAVAKRMMTERPVAALLSGGVDSSLIAALVAQQLRLAGAPPLKTFCVGMAGSSDLHYAKMVADWIGSDHHEIILDAKDFLAVIPEVIYDIESHDTTTVRASVGNWLVAREVSRQSDCKVVFNGDGSDEIFGSYLYFYGAPSDQAYEEEVGRLLKDIHLFDVLRSDRSISSHGLEPRTPFLDKSFVQTVLSIPLEFRRPSAGRPEKWLLRRAFDDGVLLPREVLWRRKEAFSDGVSGKEKAWYEIVKEYAKTSFTDEVVQHSKRIYKVNPPQTAEMVLYRTHFEKHYAGLSASTVPYFWMPKWCDATDPSARTLAVYGNT